MYQFDPATQRIIDMYEEALPIYDSVPIGFSGTASERLSVYSNEISADTLWFAFGVDFEETDVLIRVSARSPQYDWMANDDATPQDTPIGAFAGNTTQVLPMLPLIKPFFLYANGKLQYQFTNQAASPISDGIITASLLKLINPKDGKGYSYGFARK